jgi:hypothetical protein
MWLFSNFVRTKEAQSHEARLFRSWFAVSEPFSGVLPGLDSLHGTRNVRTVPVPTGTAVVRIAVYGNCRVRSDWLVFGATSRLLGARPSSSEKILCPCPCAATHLFVQLLHCTGSAVQSYQVRICISFSAFYNAPLLFCILHSAFPPNTSTSFRHHPADAEAAQRRQWQVIAACS